MPTNPIKSNSTFPKYLGEFQSQGLAKEIHGALQVGNVQMAFEEIANRNQMLISVLTHQDGRSQLYTPIAAAP